MMLCESGEGHWCVCTGTWNSTQISVVLSSHPSLMVGDTVSHPHAVIQPDFTVFSTILPASPIASFILQDFRVTQSIFLPRETLSNNRALEAGPVHTSLRVHAPSTRAKVLREKDFCFCSLATKTKIKITVLCAHSSPAHTALLFTSNVLVA